MFRCILTYGQTRLGAVKLAGALGIATRLDSASLTQVRLFLGCCLVMGAYMHPYAPNQRVGTGHAASRTHRRFLVLCLVARAEQRRTLPYATFRAKSARKRHMLRNFHGAEQDSALGGMVPI